MKNLSIILIIAAFITISCRKTRTCSCKVTSTNQSVSTPRDGSAGTTDNGTSSGTTEYTNDKMKKSDMERFGNCANRTETSSNSYTTSVFTGTGITVADVKTTYTDTYDCEIKK